MIQASEAFHEAIRNGAPQRALLRFRDAVFGNEDISVTSTGIKLTEIINGDTNLHFGLCSSARFEASLINRDNELETFDFGEFDASLGVKIGSEKYTHNGTAVVDIDSATICKASKEYPYLYINETEASVQPEFPVYGLVADHGTLYAFGEFGNVFVATPDGGGSANITQIESPTINSIMQRKIDRIIQEQRGISLTDTIMKDYHGGVADTYEFAPLGTFIAPKPNVLRKAVVEVGAEDRMQLFDTDLSEVEFEYPLMLETALDKLCESAGVQRVEQTITNADLSISQKPDMFEGATKRDLLSWIAEASATFARFDRYGRLELVRFSDTGVEYSEKDYVSLAPYTYKVPTIDKLHIRNANADNEEIAGEGDNGYLIQDNPFLLPEATTYSMLRNAASGVSAASSNILSALSEVGSFNPVSADAFTDWTMQAGDVVTFHSGDKSYKTPLYSTMLTWKGLPRITMESTGDEKSAQIPLFQRRQYGGGAGLARVEKELSETRTWAEIQLDEQSGLIALLTGSVNDLTGDMSFASARLDGLEAEIDLRVEKNGVIAAINASAEEGVLIQAEKINLEGYVIMDDFEALQGEVDRITGGTAVLDVLNVTNLVSGFISTESINSENAWFDNLEIANTLTVDKISDASSVSAYAAAFTTLTLYSNGKLTIFGRNTVWKTIYFVDEDGVGRDVTVLAQG